MLYQCLMLKSKAGFRCQTFCLAVLFGLYACLVCATGHEIPPVLGQIPNDLAWNVITSPNISSIPTTNASVATDTNLNVSSVFVDTGANAFDPDTTDSEDDDQHKDWDLESFNISWTNLDNYKMGDMLGEGSYSEVFHAVDTRNNSTCVAKILKPVKLRRLKREIKILQHLRGGPNIVNLLDVAKTTDQEVDSPALIFELVKDTSHKVLYPTLDDADVRFYMFQLLRAIEHAHTLNIMHRDIKPYNVVVDHENYKLRLIDWGLSDYYHEDYSYGSHIGSRYWRAPELLVGYEWYNPAVDMWSFGCILAGLVFQQEPFFRGRRNDANQLRQIAKTLGTESLFKWLEKYEIELDEDFDDIAGWYEQTPWKKLVKWRHAQRVSSDALDLISRVLLYDPQERLTAGEALEHPYFDLVRDWALTHPQTFTDTAEVVG